MGELLVNAQGQLHRLLASCLHQPFHNGWLNSAWGCFLRNPKPLDLPQRVFSVGQGSLFVSVISLSAYRFNQRTRTSILLQKNNDALPYSQRHWRGLGFVIGLATYLFNEFAVTLCLSEHTIARLPACLSSTHEGQPLWALPANPRISRAGVNRIATIVAHWWGLTQVPRTPVRVRVSGGEHMFGGGTFGGYPRGYAPSGLALCASQVRGRRDIQQGGVTYPAHRTTRVAVTYLCLFVSRENQAKNPDMEFLSRLTQEVSLATRNF